ncbi:MAG: hypothetical protein IPL61_38445 [Myxococcales bacterium]|nr:hypothetical protein [Myxococcales bacterium]
MGAAARLLAAGLLAATDSLAVALVGALGAASIATRPTWTASAAAASSASTRPSTSLPQ